MSAFKQIRTIIKRQFISGLIVTVPLVITFLVLRFLFESFDGILNPIVNSLLGYDIPGLGVVVAVMIILLTGIITTNFIGARLFRTGDSFLRKTPLVRVIYTAAKQLLESMVTPSKRAFSEVALIEYPRKGIYAIGFLAAECSLKNNGIDNDMRLVFIPSTPTPFTGLVVLIPIEEIYPMDMKVEEAVKILVSGGVVAPPQIKLTKPTSENGADHAPV